MSARVLVFAEPEDLSCEAVLGFLAARAAREPAVFRVVIANPAPAEWHPFHPERRDRIDAAERALLRALPAVQDAVGAGVRGHVSVRHDPMDAIEDALRGEPCDELVLVVTGHGGLGRRLHLDLPHRVRHLAPAVTVLDPRGPAAAGA